MAFYFGLNGCWTKEIERWEVTIENERMQFGDTDGMTGVTETNKISI